MVKKMTFKQFLFILPLLIFIGVFSIYPIVTSFMYTFFDYRINDQTANSFYLSERFNGELFYEDCDYINYFLDDDKTLMSEEDQKAVEEIQATVSSVMSEYENAKGTEKISSDKKDELVAFKEKLRTDITALYDKYPDVEFYNKDKIPEILDEMDTCIVKSNFIGLKAYGNLIKDTRFWKALGHTLIFTVISVGIELVLGMLLALIMNKAMKGIGLVRTVALIPWAIPTAVSAMIWSYLYDGSYGIVSFLFNKLGIINSQSAMLLTSHGAMSAAIIADVWKTTPYMALLLLAGLHHSLDAVVVADVAGIDADLIHAHVCAGQCGLVIKVDIRHDGDVHRILDGLDALGVCCAGAGHAQDLTARRLAAFRLRHIALDVLHRDIQHGLHRDGVVAADGHIADLYFSFQLPHCHFPFFRPPR